MTKENGKYLSKNNNYSSFDDKHRIFLAFLLAIDRRMAIFATLKTARYMKYNELEKLLRKAGCYDTGKQQGGHPLWHCPKTNQEFQMSNHRGEEVATGTLNKILKRAGLK